VVYLKASPFYELKLLRENVSPKKPMKHQNPILTCKKTQILNSYQLNKVVRQERIHYLTFKAIF